MRRLHLKGVPLTERIFQTSGLEKGGDFTSWVIWKGREIYHLSPMLALTAYETLVFWWTSLLVMSDVLCHFIPRVEKRDIVSVVRWVPLINKKGNERGTFSVKMVYKRVSGVGPSAEPPCMKLHVIYQTRETVFHRDIQTPRRELKKWRAAEYFWRNSRCLDSPWNTVSSVWYIFSIKTKTKE